MQDGIKHDLVVPACWMDIGVRADTEDPLQKFRLQDLSRCASCLDPTTGDDIDAVAIARG